MTVKKILLQYPNSTANITKAAGAETRNPIDQKGKWAEGWEEQAAFPQLEVHIWFREHCFPKVKGCQKSCTRIWSNFHIASSCHLHSSMKTYSWPDGHCSPSQRSCSANFTAGSQWQVHITPQVKILSQPTSYKCTIYAGRQCQSGQTSGMGTKSPAGVHGVAGIPTSWLGRAGTLACMSSYRNICSLPYLPCKWCYFPRSSQICK